MALRLSLRSLFKAPFVSIVAIASLALGIGANTAILGLAPEGFERTTFGARPAVFVPITVRDIVLAGPGTNSFEDRRSYWAYVFARLKPGISLEQARTALNVPYKAFLNGGEAPLQVGRPGRQGVSCSCDNSPHHRAAGRPPMDETDRRYPIGRFARQTTPLDGAGRLAYIDAIAHAPGAMRRLVRGLSDADLNRRYREGGWTIRQVVHHVPDSHMHAYARFKFALTEDAPQVKAYNEQRWAELPDVEDVPVTVSLDLLEALHLRWTSTLRSMSDDDFSKTYQHPELGVVPLYDALQLYAWHGRHHTAHIELALA